MNLPCHDFSSKNVVVVTYPVFAGGNFVVNCLCLSEQTVPRHLEAANQALIGTLDAAARLALMLGTLPDKDNMHAWRDHELREHHVYGWQNFHAWRRGEPMPLNDLTQKICASGKKFFLISHCIETEESNLLKIWPNATVIRFINSQRFSGISAVVKIPPGADAQTLTQQNPYHVSKYHELKGPDWPDWRDFEKHAFDITRIPGIAASIESEILAFYPPVRTNGDVITWDVDHAMFDRSAFLTSMVALYQQLGLTDFRENLLAEFYDHYISLHH